MASLTLKKPILKRITAKADLKGTNLLEANLEGTNFEEAILKTLTLRGLTSKELT